MVCARWPEAQQQQQQQRRQLSRAVLRGDGGARAAGLPMYLCWPPCRGARGCAAGLGSTCQKRWEYPCRRCVCHAACGHYWACSKVDDDRGRGVYTKPGDSPLGPLYQQHQPHTMPGGQRSSRRGQSLHTLQEPRAHAIRERGLVTPTHNNSSSNNNNISGGRVGGCSWQAAAQAQHSMPCGRWVDRGGSGGGAWSKT
jgi:hypothetical protein